MSRIPTLPTVEAAPAAAQPLLNAVKAKLGSVPNLYRLVANSPAALEGLLGLSGALGHGTLTPATRERIALAVAEANGCDYCLSAHSFIARKLLKLDDVEIAAARSGASTDPKAEAAVRFAVALVAARGTVAAAEIEKVRAAGYGDAEILEIIAHVALNTFTNYVNEALGTEIDFPAVTARAAG